MVMDRRGFLAAVAAAGVGAVARWNPSSTAGLAYVVRDGDRVQVFRETGWGWRTVHAVRSPGAAGVAVSPDGRMVYVGNAVDRFAGRPSGAVEAFVTGGVGRLRSVGRVGLALFAHGPERLAVSPDGRWLAVGLAGGGYNLLALGGDGMPGSVTASVKRIGAERESGPLVFAGGGLLVSGGEGGGTVLVAGPDGSLGFRGDASASAVAGSGVALDAGLVRAMGLAGIADGAAVALSRVARVVG